MNEKQRKMIEKLNKDNKKLVKLHEGQIEYAKMRIVMGILFIIGFIIVFFSGK